MWYFDPYKKKVRVMFGALGIFFLLIGLAMLSEPFKWANAWGAMALGPFAILFGVIFILGALFKPDIFNR